MANDWEDFVFRKIKEDRRPKGCSKTISGKHLPTKHILERFRDGGEGVDYFYCQACDKRDDTGEFFKWFESEKRLRG